MSTSLASVPKRATIAHRATATSPDGTRSAVLTVWQDRASMGYQTDYAPVMVAWYAIDAPGIVRRAWRYSGRRFVRAEQDYRAALADIRADGWAIAETVTSAPGDAGISRTLATY